MTKFVRFFAGCLLAASAIVTAPVLAAEDNRATLITFIPATTKARKELVTVEVAYKKADASRFEVLEKAVLAAKDWRREKTGDRYDIPGKCEVEVVVDRYFLYCWIPPIEEEGNSVWKEVRTPEEVVEEIRVFSQRRMIRKLPVGMTEV